MSTNHPRTTSFVNGLPPLRLRMQDFKDRDALLAVSKQVRDLQIKWATFAQNLESELEAAKAPADEPDLFPHAHPDR